MPSLNALGKLVKEKYPQYQNVSDIELGRRIKAKYPHAYQEFSGVDLPGFVKAGLGLLPAAGGLAGGLAGGAGGTILGLGVGGVPGAIGGAAVGGAGGEAVRQLAEHALNAAGYATEAPQSAGAAAKGIGLQGLEQGAYEAGGRVLGAGAKAVGRPLMELAAKATPEVAQTALQEGIAATSKGLKRLKARIGQAAARTTQDVTDAARAGQKYDGVELARQVFSDVYPEAANQPIAGPDKARLMQLTKRFLGSDANGVATNASIAADRLHVLKQSADELGNSIYAKRAMGQPITAREAIDAKWHKAFADRAREMLNATVPGYEEHNATTQSLIKVKDAIWPVAKKETSLASQIAQATMRPAGGAALGATLGAIAPADQIPGSRGQHALAGAALGALAGTPAATSTLALGTQSPLIVPALANLLRMVGTAAQYSQ